MKHPALVKWCTVGLICYGAGKLHVPVIATLGISLIVLDLEIWD